MSSKPNLHRPARADRRDATVRAGLDELELWLRDALRGGLAAIRAEAWQDIARRMVDAQAPGLARRLGAMALISPGEPGRLLDQIGRLHLLIQGYRRIESLPPEMQAEVRAQIGFTEKQDELRQQDGVRDVWLVMGQRTEIDDNGLYTMRTWLAGLRSGKTALTLQFQFGKAPSDEGVIPGVCLDAEIVYFPGAYPLRALFKAIHGEPTGAETFPQGYGDVRAAISAYADALARNPWLDRFPMTFEALLPVRDGETLYVRDTRGDALPLRSLDWRLIALSGGRPIALFGEYYEDRLHHQSAWVDGRFIAL